MSEVIKCMEIVVKNPSIKSCRKFVRVGADKRKSILLKKLKKCFSKSFKVELTETEDHKIQVEFFPNYNTPMQFNFVKTINASLEAFGKEIAGKCYDILSQHDDL